MSSTDRTAMAIALVLAVNAVGAAGADTAAADAAREVLRKHCAGCHGAGKDAKAGLRVLDVPGLLARGLVQPGDPNGSELLQLVECGSMPPGVLPKLGDADRRALRDWIAGGAAPFPAESGESYVVRRILNDLRGRSGDPAALAATRYVSFHHLPADPAAVRRYRDALLKAVNHLSLKPQLARPEAVEPTGTVFRLDLRELGWDATPFEAQAAPGEREPSRVNLFDLLLLDYPFAPVTLLPDGPDRLAAEYLRRAGLVRPVLYVRGDWLVSVATQPPLYDDLLRLPRTLAALEQRLGLPPAGERTGRAARAGLADSAVSKRNRLAERIPTPEGAYWRTYELSSAGADGLVRDAALTTGAGLALFSLPNGLFGCFIADRDGRRLDEVPAGIVADPLARDGVARNGLSCLRCHDAGVKPLADTVHAAVRRSELPPADKERLLALYPGPAAIDALLAGDRRRYTGALASLFGQPPDREPLGPVTKEFLDRYAADGTAPPARGVVTLVRADLAARPPVWERLADAGPRLLPLDGLTHPDYRPPTDPLDVTLTTLNHKTGKPATTFIPGDELAVEVTNRGDREIFFELVSATLAGRRDVRQAVRRLGPGQTYRYPRDRERNPREFIPIDPELGKDQYIVYASASAFPGGVRLRGADLNDRVVHPFYELSADGSRAVAKFDPARFVKRTVVIETRLP